MSPHVSIITPSLNQGAYLPRALASVAAQRGVQVEHLVFDAGSIDGSRAVLRSWREGGAERRLFLEKDAGPADAINKGVEQAQGEVIGWLCADDVYADEHALAAVCAAFGAHPEVDIVYGRGAFIDAADGVAGFGPFQRDATKLAQTWRASAPFVQPAVFVRRSLFARIGGFDAAFGRAFDVAFWLRAAQAGAIFMALDVDLARKRLHADTATHLLGGVHAMDCARATRAHFGAAAPAWVARAVAADVVGGGDAGALVAEVVSRRLNRVRDSDFLVVLGNGPSLAGFDFAQLRGIDCIGMNAAYRHWREIGWYPRYYACLDTVVGLSHRAEIEAMIVDADALGVDAFLLRDNLIQTLGPAARGSPRVISFDALTARGGLMDASPLTTGSHAALFGGLLGYRRMALLGIDCNYVERIDGAQPRDGTELELIAAPARNPNYFFEGYQRAGDRYNIPNPVPDLHIDCWRAVGARLAGRGVEVWNASRISRVDAFAYRPFSRLKASAGEGAFTAC